MNAELWNFVRGKRDFHMTRRLTLAAMVLGPVVALFASAADSSNTVTVTIAQMQFTPAEVHVKVGDTVVWTNNDDRDHTVIAADGSFSSGNISSGQSFSHKFTAVGNFGYGCKYHPRMKGMVVVVAAAAKS
jgi:plastocyanin